MGQGRFQRRTTGRQQRVVSQVKDTVLEEKEGKKITPRFPKVIVPRQSGAARRKFTDEPLTGKKKRGKEKRHLGKGFPRAVVR